MAHAHHGGCTTWVDDCFEELQERGLLPPDAQPPSCCGADAAKEAAAAQLHAQLVEADPTRVAQRLHSLSFAPPPNAAEPRSEDESSDFGSDDDDTGAGSREELAALRERRLRQLSALAAAPAAGCYEGVRVRELPALLASLPPSVALVLHLPLPGLAACDQLDELLSSLARSTPARCRFARIEPDGGAAPLCAASAALLGAAPGEGLRPPALSVLRRGRRPALSRGLSALGEWPEEGRLRRWLARAGALAAEGGGSESEGEEEEAEGLGASVGAPCRSCGRTYPHEHVRALRAGVRCEEEEE